MNALFDCAETWLLLLAGLSWKGAVFALAVALIVVSLRRQLSPGWRHALWLLVLLRFALPDMGESRWSMMGWLGNEPALAAPSVPMIDGSAEVAEVTEPVESQMTEAVVPAVSVIAEPLTPPLESNPWTVEQKLALGWLVGVMGMLGTMLALHLRLLRRLRADGEPPSSRVAGILRDAASLAGVSRMPRVRVTDAVRAPALFGLFRPMILLPRDVAESCEASALRLILLHEIAHLRRRDLWTQVMASLILAVHWFNPLVWWAGRRLRVEAEMAADALALRYTDVKEAHRFGTVLLDFANRAAAGWLLWLSSATLLGISENKHDLKRRIEALKDVASRRRTRWGMGLLVFALLSFTGLTRTPAQTAPASAPQPAGTAATAEPGVVIGVVVDDRGKPVVGASCSLRIGSDEDPEVRKAVSDAQGRFRFEGVPDSTALQLRALHPDYVSPRESQPKFSSQDRNEHRLVLVTATSWLTGTVTRKSDGQPVADAAVYVSVAYDSGLIGLIGGRAKARTNAQGQFRVVKSSFDKEKGHFWVDAPGMALNVVQFAWKEGGQAIDAVLEPEKLLTGKVVDADGRPVKDATLSLCGRLYTDGINRIRSPESGYYSVGSGYWMGEPVTDAQGAFSTRMLVTSTVGDQWLVAQHPTAGIRYVNVRDWKPGGTLTLDRWASAEGRLLDQNDQPVADAEIRFSAGTYEKNDKGDIVFSIDIRASVRTDAEGHYKHDRIMPGSTGSYVTVNGKIVQFRRSVFEPGVTKTVDIRLPAPNTSAAPVPAEKTRQVQGRVVTPAGRQVVSHAWTTRMSVSALTEGGMNDQADLESSGRFETRSLPVGDYLLSVWVSPKDSKLRSASKGGLSMAFKVEADAARKPLDLGEFKLAESDFAFRPLATKSGSWPKGKVNAEVEDAASFATWTFSHGRGAAPEQKFTDGRAVGEGFFDMNHQFILRATKPDGSRHFSPALVASEDAEVAFDQKVRLSPAIAVKGRVRPLPEDYDGQGWIIAGVAVRAELKPGVVMKGTPPLTWWYAWAPVPRDGTFAFPALPRGSVTLAGFGNGWSTATTYSAGSVQVKTAGQTSSVDVVIDTLPSIDRRVRLLLPDGKPAAGATLTLMTTTDAPLALTTRGHEVEARDAAAYASYKKRSIPGHKAMADGEGLATLRNQLDQPYGSTTCEVKWTDPKTLAARTERVKIDHTARSPQEIRLGGDQQ
ncbi:MAG: hypothetical protein IAE77_23060 [Prosthecobacter sp.]|jgi:beta-lactamase regulating signal transducer with metallopeptidase domain/protocatechuate 3,4-dioxygenase beta subunit|uniref:M56 family metallopeptidase n=1 Tax=Prosthecobacter sp. TaxID=1965333 RepID=UPI0019FE942E|nr:M56 family metallopeptidase [Prosthecobacter sp.]MBE2286355.1 hypothetical protein [Prosthecobacter sp.]